jgi:hypothetical protein
MSFALPKTLKRSTFDLSHEVPITFHYRIAVECTINSFKTNGLWVVSSTSLCFTELVQLALTHKTHKTLDSLNSREECTISPLKTKQLPAT